MTPRLNKPQAADRIAKLRRTIDHHRYLYHVLDRQEISDAALDSLKRELQSLETEFPELVTPDSPTQRVGGKPLAAFRKVQHVTRMFSLTDVFSRQELNDWDGRWRKLQSHAKTKYLVDLKLDGLAISLQYQSGRLNLAATRGDGQVGEDVTQNVKTIEAVPLALRTDGLRPAVRTAVLRGKIILRGEVVMLKKDFEALNRRQTAAGHAPFANPRNVAAGSIRQLDSAMTAARKLDFYAWELVTDCGQTTRSEGYQLLRSFGFRVNPRYAVAESLDDVETFYARMQRQREQLPFWIDGIVVKIDQRELSADLGFVGKAPRAATAWKFAAEQATTVVEDIVVQVGRTGAITPVAHLQPVNVAGTTVSRATLHNADEIKRLDIRVGDTMIIHKAGDIIPDVVRVLTDLRPSKTRIWTMPERCPMCRARLKRQPGEAITYCANSKCPARQREALYHFVSKKAFDINTLGPSTVDVLVDEGLVREPADFFQLTTSDLIGLPLFAELKSEKLIASIHAARTQPFDRLLYSLGIRHVGEETARDLADHFQTIDHLMQASAEDFERIPNIGTIVAASIADYFRDNDQRASLRRLLRHLTIRRVRQSVSGPLQGKTVVLTGTLITYSRDEAEAAVRQAGGKTTQSVSKKTGLVVVGENPGSKADKARQLGIRIVPEAEFTRLLNRPRS